MMLPRSLWWVGVGSLVLTLAPGSWAQTTAVTLAATASPTAGQPGVTAINLTGSNFPSGTINAPQVTVTLEPATVGGGPTATTAATSIATIVGTTRRVGFTIPNALTFAAPASYLVSIAGITTTGLAFASSNKSALTVNPPASLLSVTPNSGNTGQSLTVTLATGYTNFVQGSTRANFGAGISVGGAAEGTLGPVTVLSPTSATAQIAINPAAAGGPRTVSVATGIQQASLAAGFAVLAPTLLSVNPGTGRQGQQNLQVSISGQFTHFVQGTTTVSFGAGITVASMTVNSATSATALLTIDPIAATGARNVTLTTNTEVATLANGFTVTAGNPAITITSPANLSYLNITPTTVNGTVNPPTATVTINGLAAPVANGNFSIALPLLEGPNIIAATAASTAGTTGTASIQVTLDTTPPHVTITSPPDQFVTTDTSISVAGNVNDIVVGTVNSQQAQVTVNGVAAQVANRTFLAVNVPLNMGNNVIQAVARDRVGNAATTQITVTRQAPSQSSQIRLISGNNQTGLIGSVVPAPLVVALTDAVGSPVPNKAVIFKATQNNGMVSAGGAPTASVIATTNAQGQAQAQWTLGTRAGSGGNTVEAYSVGFGGTAIFTATGTQGPAGKIVVDTGNNQVGAVNQPLPLPLIAVVVDSGNNRLANVPVTFAVQQGGGNFAGQPSFTVNTDSDGRAAATLTVGFQEGNANNLVTATFPSNQGFPATFTASGRAPGNPASTTISGIVLDNSNVAIPGVTIRAVLTNVLSSNPNSVPSAATALTNAQGQFSIKPAPVGFVKLLIDGSTAQRIGTYPNLEYDIVTVAGQNNTVGQPMFLLPLNSANQLCVTATTGGGTLTIPEAPGFSLTFGPGQVTFPGGSKGGCVSVTVVHGDKVPMVPGFGQQPRFIVTIQPSGALFNPPAPITLPNVDGLKPREVTEMYSFDHDIGSFVAIGTGTVSDDGQVIRSNQGVGVLKAGWHCGGNPNPNGTAAHCGTCATCIGNNCVPNTAGTVCGACWYGGSCTGATTCTGAIPKPYGTSCGTCYNGGICDGSGNCLAGSSAGNGSPCSQSSCITGQTCQNGACQGGTPVPAGTMCQSGGNPCRPGACDSSGNCVAGPPLPTGTSCSNRCTTGGVCDANGTCVGGTSGVNCDDGNFCNGLETCDPINGGCMPGTPPIGAPCGVCMVGGTCSGAGTCTGGTPAPANTSCGACYSGGTCNGSGNCVGGTQLANGTSCGNGAVCLNGSCGQITVTVSQIQSDQLPGVTANFLPQGAGGRGNLNPNYILMGTRGGTVAVKAQLSISPNTAAARNLVLVRLSTSSSPQGTSSIDSNDVATVILNEPTSVTDYQLVAGVDKNQDGSLDANEVQVTASQGIFRVVPSSVYNSTIQDVNAGNIISRNIFPTASEFLTGFANGVSPAQAQVGSSTLVYNAPGLSHNVGARFVGAPPTASASIPVYAFMPGSALSDKILNSSALSDSFNNSCINNTFSQHRQDVTSPGTFVWPIVCPTGPNSIRFATLDPDLALALHAAEITGTVMVTVSRSLGLLIETNTIVDVVVKDLYDFDYDSSDRIARFGARIQAGFPSLGNGGQVFRIEARAAGTPSRLIPFVF